MTGLVQMFYAPGRVFDDIRENRRSWILPMLAVILLNTIVSALIINLVGYEHVIRRSIEGNKAVAERLGPAGVEQAIAQANSPARRAMTMVMPAVGLLVALPLVAGLLLAIL